ncbi:MAG TPA: hypothetical protein DCR04_03220 [Flavobacteriales bacterium]|nr:hypothetical protein [Flavobacteriales bacterium]
MKKLLPFILIGLVACDQKPNEAILDPESNASYTKTMVYAVDLNSVFHEDLNDEDYSDVAPITQQLIADVLDGKLKALDPISEEVITSEQVKAMLVFTDTIWFEEPETGDKSIDVLERDYTTEFYGLTFKEQWSYDKAGSVLNKKIVGLAPRIPVYSSQGGELRGYTSAFWVKYD